MQPAWQAGELSSSCQTPQRAFGDTLRAEGREAASDSLAEPLKVGLAQAGVGSTPPLSLLRDPLPLTLKSPLPQSSLFYTLAPGTPGLGRPSAGQHLPGTGWGNRWWRCPLWHQHLVPGAGRGGRDYWTTAPMALVHSRKKGGRGQVWTGVGGRAGRSFCGSVCGKVLFCFFPSPPFFLK